MQYILPGLGKLKIMKSTDIQTLDHMIFHCNLLTEFR